jgi:hypothetical protein
LDQASRYEQLEMGARHLARISTDAEERRIHLGWANRYYRLRLEAGLALPNLNSAEAA